MCRLVSSLLTKSVFDGLRELDNERGIESSYHWPCGWGQVSGAGGIENMLPAAETAAQQAPERRFSPGSGIPTRFYLENHVELE